MSNATVGPRKDKEDIRALLRKAFANVPCPYKEVNTARLGHDAFRKLRTELNLFTPEAVQFYLPRVLEDLLDTHTNDPVNSEDSDAVVRYLNGLCSTSDFEWLKEYGGEGAFKAASDEQTQLRHRKAVEFAIITNKQAFAIHQWLLLAQSWEDLILQPKEVEGAIAYWKERIGPGPSSNSTRQP